MKSEWVMSEWVHTFEKHRSENCSGEFHVDTSTLYTFMYTDPTYRVSYTNLKRRVRPNLKIEWVMSEWVHIWEYTSENCSWELHVDTESSTLTLSCTQILYKGICRDVKVSEWWVSEYVFCKSYLKMSSKDFFFMVQVSPVKLSCHTHPLHGI